MADVLSTLSFTNPTPLTAVQAASQALIQSPTNILTYLIKERIYRYNQLWNNPGIGCSPSALAAQIGTNLQSLFQRDAMLVAFIIQVAATISPAPVLPAAAIAGIPAGRTVTFNNDGSGTIV